MRSSDNELFRDKIEVSLDGKQIFYLFFGGAIIASLVFVLGVMVGKRLEARAHVHAQAETSAANDPLAALDKLAGKRDQLTFANTLTGDRVAPLGKVDKELRPKIAEREATEAAARQKEKEARLEKLRKKQEEKAKREALLAKKKAKEEEAKKRREELNRKRHAEAEARRRAQLTASKNPDSVADDGLAVNKSAAAAVATKAKPTYTLQLSSFRDRTEADSFHEKLSKAGYSPYVVEAKVNGRAWFRVRLGRYESYSDAIEAKARFEKKQHIIAYVTRLRG
jgi:cell division protein FtsN